MNGMRGWTMKRILSQDWIRTAFTATMPNEKEIKGDGFFITENQIYRTIVYFFNKKGEDGSPIFPSLFPLKDSEYLHSRAKLLAHEILNYKDHKLRPVVYELVEYLPGDILF